MRLEQGYAADCAADGRGGVWVAWSACLSDETALLAEISRTWPMKAGVTAEDWRRREPATFTLTLSHVDAGGNEVERVEIARSAWAIEGPALAGAVAEGEGPVVVWCERDADGCRTWLWWRGRGRGSDGVRAGDDERRAVSATGAVAHSPAVVRDAAGSVWVAWAEGEGEGSAVRVWREGTAEGGTRLSQPGGGAWAPALASDNQGRVWCAWDGWREGLGEAGRYEIRLRGWEPAADTAGGGRWGDEMSVRAGDDGFDLSPSLAVDGAGRLWVAWSHSNAWGRLNHRFAHRRSVHVRVLEPPGREQLMPKGHAPGGAVPLAVEPIDDPREEEWVVPASPKLVRHGEGVRLVYRRMEHAEYMGFGWSVWSAKHAGDGWREPERLGSAGGFPDTALGVAEAPGGALWVAAHTCAYGHPVSGGALTSGEPARRTFSKHAVSEDAVLVERMDVELPTRPEGGDLSALAVRSGTEEAAEVGARPAPTRIAAAPAEVERRLTHNGSEYELLFGDLHRHSAYSKCLAANDGDVLDHARWATDVARLDFYALTEHMEYMSYGEWRWVDRFASLLTRDSRVLALHGFETAIPPGHTNFFYLDERIGELVRIAYLSSNRLEEVWLKLDAWVPAGSVIAIRHHQGHGQAEVAKTFAPRYEPVVEILQSRGEYRGWADRLLGLGLEAGFVGATDHTYAGAFPRGLTGVWADERTREGVFEALRGRRTFATNGPKMRVFLSAAGMGMGERGVCERAAEIRLELEMEGTTRLERAELYRDGRLAHVQELGERRATVHWRDPEPVAQPTFYYARVLQEREHRVFQPHYGVAYTSPVWLEPPASLTR